MNRSEAAQIVAYLNRAGLVGAMEGQAAVWADALTDVSFVTAQEVAQVMARTRTSRERWVTPGDVRDAVQTLRTARTRDMRTPEPPDAIEPDDWATQTLWTRAYLAAVADGLSEQEAEDAACAEVRVTPRQVDVRRPPVAELVAGGAARTTLPRDVVSGARRDVANERRRP